MKVIFLDVDGVLNNDSTKERLWNGFIGINKRLCAMFIDWLKTRPDYKIVLSSTWRSGKDYMAELNDHGVFWVDVTPNNLVMAGSIIKGHIRGDEIQAVLDQGWVQNYAILDDMGPDNFLKAQQPFLVQTSYIHGLRPKNLDKIDKILMRT